MNQGGIVGLAQMQSPFANSIRPQAQTMGPGSYTPNISQGPQQMGPMQRNFMQMQNQMRGMQQNPLELYQGYLGQKYIGPMQQEQQNKISQFVGAVSQAERQAFGNPQGGKTFGGRLQPGMPGSGLMPPMNQAPDVMPPMNQAPAVMPDGYSDRAAELEPVFMNQGGMMYSDIMNRPMFQTPQQRQGMGIMAGVAPVRGYEEGGMATPEYTPKFMREEDSEEDGLGRMLFEFFIVDPDDPVDVGLASASAAMVAGGITAPGAVATQLARMGYKGKKLFDAVKKIESLGKPSNPDAGIVRRATAPVTGTIGATMTAREIPEIPSYIEAAGGIGDLVRDSVMKNEAQGYAMGGIAQLSEGGFLEKLMALLPKKAQKGVEILERAIDSGQATFDDIFNAFRKGEIDEKQLGDLNKRLPEADQGTLVQPGQRLNIQDGKVSKVETDRTGTGVLQDTAQKRIEPKMKADDIATPPESKMPTPPKPPAKVADDAAGAAEEAGEAATKKSRLRPDGRSIKRQVATGTGKAAGIAGGAGVASDIGLGTNFISTGLEKIGDTYGAVRDDVAATLEMPEIVALRERVNPDTGERVELTESVMEQVDLNKDGKISDEERKAIKEKADKAVAAQQKPDTGTGTGTPKPEATGIMKFLFGKDGIGGDPGAVGKTMDYLADPRTRYALARAAESRPGVVNRNFFTDFTLGQAEYDQLQGKDETALMQNYEFLKAAGKSDDEIFNLLLSKDTESDLMDTYRDAVLTLYKEADENPNNTGVDRDDLLKQAQMRAAQIVFGTQSSAPQDSEVVQTVELE